MFSLRRLYLHFFGFTGTYFIEIVIVMPSAIPISYCLNITLTARCHCFFASLFKPFLAPPFRSERLSAIATPAAMALANLLLSLLLCPPPYLAPVSHMNPYASSQLTRYPCPKCGTYVRNMDPDVWEFASGMLSSTEEILDKVQIWIEGTKDGVASIWLKRGHGSNPSRHLRDRKSPEATDSVLEDIYLKSDQQATSINTTLIP